LVYDYDYTTIITIIILLSVGGGFVSCPRDYKFNNHNNNNNNK